MSAALRVAFRPCSRLPRRAVPASAVESLSNGIRLVIKFLKSPPTLLCVIAALLALQSVANAHPESASILQLKLAPAGLHATMTLPTRDLTRWFPPGRYPDYVADVIRELQGQADTLLEVRCDDAVAHLSGARVHRGLTGCIIAELDYPVPDGAAELRVRSTSIGNLPNDHQELTSIEDDRGPTPGGRILFEETLTAQQDTLSVDLPTVEIGADKSPAPPVATSLALTAPILTRTAQPENRQTSNVLPWIGCALLVAAAGGLWFVRRNQAARRTV
jgi:hypothetical protein